MNTPINLRQQLVRDEGRVAHAYQDSLGFWTIGVGHLIDKRRGGGLPDHIIDALLDHDVAAKTEAVLAAFPWAARLTIPRFSVLVNMAFQLGITGLSQFKQALGHLEAGDYEAAATAFLDSKVAREQTPERWARHAEQIRSNQWQ